MDLRLEIQKPLRRFFLQFFNQFATDTEMLVSKPVASEVREVKLLQGADEIDRVFEKESALVFAREDGTNLGDLHLLFDVRSAIALSGLMMMLPPGPLADKVRLLSFDETLQEAFQEIGNISMGALNSLVETEIENGHLFMDGTALVADGAERPAEVASDAYVIIVAEITVGDFEREPFRVLISQGIAEKLCGSPLTTPEEVSDSVDESSGAGPGAFPEGSELASLMADPASAADEAATVSQAIAMMEKDGVKQVGVLRDGVLIRVISRSDLRQLMGPFYGTNAMTPRDKAVLNLPLGRISKNQQLISISASGSRQEAVERIIENDLRSLPVVDDQGALLGFIPTRELLKLLRTVSH